MLTAETAVRVLTAEVAALDSSTGTQGSEGGVGSSGQAGLGDNRGDRQTGALTMKSLSMRACIAA